MDNVGTYSIIKFFNIIAHVRKIKVKPAEKVFVAPLEAIPPIDERYLSDSHESVSMTKGDNFIVPYFGGRLNFQGVVLTPATSEAVIINQGTQFIITERDQALGKCRYKSSCI